MTETKQDVKSLFKTIVVWGEGGSGKTLFGLTSPIKPILMLDMHDSARLYEIDAKRLGLEFTRVDLKSQPYSSAGKPAVESKHWGTIVIDTVQELWLPFMQYMAKTSEDVQKNFAMGLNQIAMAQIGREFANLIKGIMSRCDLLVMTAWEGEFNKKKYPKCPDVVLNLTDLVIHLERDPNKKIPSGVLTRKRFDGLPPRLPEATWKTLAHYIQNPVNYESLAPEEQVVLMPVSIVIGDEL